MAAGRGGSSDARQFYSGRLSCFPRPFGFPSQPSCARAKSRVQDTQRAFVAAVAARHLTIVASVTASRPLGVGIVRVRLVVAKSRPVRRSTERNGGRRRAVSSSPRRVRIAAKASQNAITPRTNSSLTARIPIPTCGGRCLSSQMRTSTRRNFTIEVSFVDLHTSESSFEWTIVEFGRVGIAFWDLVGGLRRVEVGVCDRKTRSPHVRKPFRALVCRIPTRRVRQKCAFSPGFLRIRSRPGSQGEFGRRQN